MGVSKKDGAKAPARLPRARKTATPRKTASRTKRASSSTTARRAVAKGRALSAEVEAQVCAVLLELMRASESDAVRVSAAKALMDQTKRKTQDEDGDDGQADRNERCEAIAEIRRIMGELADAKSGGGAGADALDRDGATGSTDS